MSRKEHLADMRSVVDRLFPMASLDAVNATDEQRHDRIHRQFAEVIGALHNINGFVRERANADAARWRDLGERLNGIEADLEGDGDREGSVPLQLDALGKAICDKINDLNPAEWINAIGRVDSDLYKALVAKGWTPPQ